MQLVYMCGILGVQTWELSVTAALESVFLSQHDMCDQLEAQHARSKDRGSTVVQQAILECMSMLFRAHSLQNWRACADMACLLPDWPV